MEQALITFEIEEGEKPTVLKLQKHNARDIYYYRFGKSTPLRALFLDYCFRTGHVFKDTKFVYNDCRIPETCTPEHLEMLNSGRDNVIHVFSSRSDKLIDMYANWKSAKSFLANEEDRCVYLTVSEFASDGKNKCYCYYKCSRDMPLFLLMLDYCERRGFSRYYDLCFQYKSPSLKENGVHVLRVFRDGDMKTPNELQMNDHDVLDACVDKGNNPTIDRVTMERLNPPKADSRTFAIKAGEKLIKLTVRRQSCKNVCYNISRKMPLRYLMIDYCNQSGLVVRFIFNGAFLRWESTAEELEMEDEDVIDAFTELLGGA